MLFLLTAMAYALACMAIKRQSRNITGQNESNGSHANVIG